MDTGKLKTFAQTARQTLLAQVKVALDHVLNIQSVDNITNKAKIDKLRAAIAASNEEAIIERVAYVWFNRFCALRYMDVNNLNKVRIVSASGDETQPEILSEAKSGHIDDAIAKPFNKQNIINLLNRTKPSNDPEGEAYRELFIAACNSLNTQLPFMFETIDDYAELLLPHDLLAPSSVLSQTCAVLDTDTCANVEVIGWLYQYYISAKKDKVFDDIKKKKIKVTPENIPAVTQLFTPHWIVKYLVENSLGRLWMLNNPNSNLISKMEYYIKPESVETEFLRVTSPEEIKICDPACGSGHMLTYAFDLLYEIYAECGYENSQIPSLILKNNLFGIEIDDRAGALASFALSMKACEKDRRFLGRENRPEPNICVLEDIKFHEGDLKLYLDELNPDLLTTPLINTLHDFREAKNFGSLIRPSTNDVAGALNELSQKDMGGNLLLFPTHEAVLKALKFADYLSPKYHIVVANPPYMGGSNGTSSLGEFLKLKYPDSKTDLFAAFIERNLELNFKFGMTAMVTMQSWMFLSSYEKLRIKLLENKTILSMAHLGARGFDSIGGEVVQTTAFVLENGFKKDFEGTFFRLVDGRNEAEKAKMLKSSISNTVLVE